MASLLALGLVAAACASDRAPHPVQLGNSAKPVARSGPPSSRLTAHPLGASPAPSGYYEYLPPGYGDQPRPLLIFLHGHGESGDGSAGQLDRLLNNGVPELIRQDRWPNDRPFVVLAPQHNSPNLDDPLYADCQRVRFEASCWFRVQHDLGHPIGRSMCATPAEVHAFITYALATYDVDPERVYIAGLSCGAYAAFEYAAVYGDSQVAAVVAISGDARPALAAAGSKLSAVPIWAFHGDADELVAPAGTIEPMAALPADRTTIYPGVGHDAWTRTLDLSAGHDIYRWLLEHRRSR